MSGLPKIERPFTKTKLLSRNKKVQVSAFTTAEEKILLLAREAGTTEEILDAIVNIVKHCVDDKSIVIEDLPMFDIIQLFIDIVEISKGSTIFSNYKCKCGKRITKELSLKDVKLSDKIEKGLLTLTPSIKVSVEYPTYRAILDTKDDIEKIKEKNPNITEKILKIEEALHLYAYCITQIYSGEEVISPKDYTKEELYEWFIGMPESAITEFKTFFDSTPKQVLEFDLVCPACGTSEHFEYSELESFFC